jgi:hypothetical protein
MNPFFSITEKRQLQLFFESFNIGNFFLQTACRRETEEIVKGCFCSAVSNALIGIGVLSVVL